MRVMLSSNARWLSLLRNLLRIHGVPLGFARKSRTWSALPKNDQPVAKTRMRRIGLLHCAICDILTTNVGIVRKSGSQKQAADNMRAVVISSISAMSRLAGGKP